MEEEYKGAMNKSKEDNNNLTVDCLLWECRRNDEFKKLINMKIKFNHN